MSVGVGGTAQMMLAGRGAVSGEFVCSVYASCAEVSLVSLAGSGVLRNRNSKTKRPAGGAAHSTAQAPRSSTPAMSGCAGVEPNGACVCNPILGQRELFLGCVANALPYPPQHIGLAHASIERPYRTQVS